MDLCRRSLRRDRVESFRHRFIAALCLHWKFEEAGDVLRLGLCEQWRLQLKPRREALRWSSGQEEYLHAVKVRLEQQAEQLLSAERQFIFLTGEPGSGKTEVLLSACRQCLLQGLRVMVMAPTGALVASYQERLPEESRLSVTTLHAGLRLQRNADSHVRFAPPSYLNNYDVFFVDEVSQIDDSVWQRLYICLREMPGVPLVSLSGDFQQLPALGTQRFIRAHLATLYTVTLQTVFRTEDTVHLNFQRHVRLRQPEKRDLWLLCFCFVVCLVPVGSS